MVQTNILASNKHVRWDFLKNKVKWDIYVHKVSALILKNISISDFTLKWVVLKLQKIQTFKADDFVYDG